ncbi:MAG: rRNA maturation RNase YbeY, partial [Clostridia bacterium]|nr:rRNA maturation RNase YbeY [Clostridia bacterium]
NIGDVVICLDKAKEQAVQYGHSLKREICFLALHGTLHLLGYDHIEQYDEEQMTRLQEEIMNKMKITRK